MEALIGKLRIDLKDLMKIVKGQARQLSWRGMEEKFVAKEIIINKLTFEWRKRCNYSSESNYSQERIDLNLIRYQVNLTLDYIIFQSNCSIQGNQKPGSENGSNQWIGKLEYYNDWIFFFLQLNPNKWINYFNLQYFDSGKFWKEEKESKEWEDRDEMYGKLKDWVQQEMSDNVLFPITWHLFRSKVFQIIFSSDLSKVCRSHFLLCR